MDKISVGRYLQLKKLSIVIANLATAYSAWFDNEVGAMSFIRDGMNIHIFAAFCIIGALAAAYSLIAGKRITAISTFGISAYLVYAIYQTFVSVEIPVVAAGFYLYVLIDLVSVLFKEQ